MKLFEELKRRNVFRAAGLYGVVGWSLAQVAGVLEASLGMPAWFDTVVVSLLLIGFPLFLVFSWVFEMTPEGLKKTSEIPEGSSIATSTGKKLDRALIAAVVVLIAVIIADRFIFTAKPGAELRTAGAETNAPPETPEPPGGEARAVEPDNSIAVLPFTDMSPEKDQEYFSDGISEELLNVLAQVQGLQVAGRTSSFAFKGQNKDLREIGEVLNVAHILEGSVRKAGDKVRITAQLIKAKDGYHLWSQTYDRDLNDIFAVQDEISRAIVAEISPKLSGASALKPVARADIAAYELFLLAREKMTQDGSRAAYESAERLLDDAIAQDPHYAPALAWRAYAETMLSDVPGGVGNRPMATAIPVVKEYADRAMAEDATSPEAIFALGSYYGQLSFAEGVQHLDKTIELMRRAVELRPSFPQAQNDLAYFLDLAGEKAQAVSILEEVLAHDPGLRDANVTYFYHLANMGRLDEAEASLDRWARIRSDHADIDGLRMTLLGYRGEIAKAWNLSVERANAGLNDGRLSEAQFFYRRSLHDGQWILDNNPNGRRKAVGAVLEGDRKRAVQLVDGDAVARMNVGEALESYIPIHFAAGDFKAVAAYYDKEMKTPAGAMQAAHYCSCSPLPLALSLRAAKHKDYSAVLSAWKASTESMRGAFARSSEWNADMADIAVLEGDLVNARKHYASGMDFGRRDPFFTSRLYRGWMPADAELDALMARMTSLINEQRRQLGMPPITAAKG